MPSFMALNQQRAIIRPALSSTSTPPLKASAIDDRGAQSAPSKPSLSTAAPSQGTTPTPRRYTNFQVTPSQSVVSTQPPKRIHDGYSGNSLAQSKLSTPTVRNKSITETPKILSSSATTPKLASSTSTTKLTSSTTRKSSAIETSKMNSNGRRSRTIEATESSSDYEGDPSQSDDHVRKRRKLPSSFEDSYANIRTHINASRLIIRARENDSGIFIQAFRDDDTPLNILNRWSTLVRSNSNQVGVDKANLDDKIFRKFTEEPSLKEKISLIKEYLSAKREVQPMRNPLNPVFAPHELRVGVHQQDKEVEVFAKMTASCPKKQSMSTQKAPGVAVTLGPPVDEGPKNQSSRMSLEEAEKTSKFHQESLPDVIKAMEIIKITDKKRSTEVEELRKKELRLEGWEATLKNIKSSQDPTLAREEVVAKESDHLSKLDTALRNWESAIKEREDELEDKAKALEDLEQTEHILRQNPRNNRSKRRQNLGSNNVPLRRNTQSSLINGERTKRTIRYEGVEYEEFKEREAFGKLTMVTKCSADVEQEGRTYFKWVVLKVKDTEVIKVDGE
ncbi:hypothetical protein G7Y89_g7620 [Cudoniella acicularis]|uniref:Uncharacterized protein n=1 Tax=Cudoniella acicularis TaxID=354080 RepID=A0A8H4RLP8_9HELO|nr:hypothetical protein G7Y89_g7620 [Cudoniella acicularis]